MNIVFIVSSVCLFLYSVNSVDAVSGYRIKQAARQHIGSTKWSFSSGHAVGHDENKCNIFVADVIEEAGGSVPRRYFGLGGVIGAGEWGNPNSSYLRRSRCWSNINTNSYRDGDVIGDGRHVGIVTGVRTTTSAAHDKVVENDWGFRGNQRVTFWRYTC